MSKESNSEENDDHILDAMKYVISGIQKYLD
jgi:hypothetical protein